MSLERNRSECLPCTSCLRSHYKQNIKAISEWWCNSSVKMAICSLTLSPNRHKEEKAALGKWQGYNRNVLYCNISKHNMLGFLFNNVINSYCRLIKSNLQYSLQYTQLSVDSKHCVRLYNYNQVKNAVILAVQ